MWPDCTGKGLPSVFVGALFGCICTEMEQKLPVKWVLNLQSKNRVTLPNGLFNLTG